MRRSTSTSRDEIGQLADSFNHMTRDLLDQRDRLVQAERVAAWRELARRLAHELKNPLFPLQLTVENLLRARELGQQQFDETFQESASTLLAEISHLKAIIGRFSEFSRMPQPQFQAVDLNQLAEVVVKLHKAQLNAAGRPPIKSQLDLSAAEPIAADPELLHRALSNLVLNAIEAMPDGGTLTLRTREDSSSASIEVSDTGTGLITGRMRAPVHSLLHQQSGWHRTRSSHRAVHCQRPRRQNQRQQRARPRDYIYDRVACEPRQIGSAGKFA